MTPLNARLLEELWEDRGTIFEGRSEDHISRAFLGLAQKLEAGLEIENPRAYLVTSAYRAAIDDSRLASNDDLPLGKQAFAQSHPFASPRIALMRTALMQALDTLPYEDAQAWAATEIQGLTVREAEPVLGTSYRTVARRAERARAQLAKELA